MEGRRGRRVWRGIALGALVLLAACHPSKRPDVWKTSPGGAATSASANARSNPALADASPLDADVTSRASVSDMGHDEPSALEGGAFPTLDGAYLRARSRALLTTRAPVTVLRGGTPMLLGHRLCEAVVPRKPAATPILLKPNLGGFDWFKDPKTHGGDDGVAGRITDPEFVRGVVRCLKARGHRAITVADGWGGSHAEWGKLVTVSGYAAMAKDEGVALVAMNDDGVFDRDDGPGAMRAVSGMDGTGVPGLRMAKVMADHLTAGLVISLPKMKVHRFAVVSLAIKGLQGNVALADGAPAYKQKWRMHRELNPYLATRRGGGADDRGAYVTALQTFAERIADVLEVEAPDVVLAEGAPRMGGDGFQTLVPLDEPVAVGSTNAILADRVGAELLGLWDNPALARELGGHATSPLLTTAARRFAVDITTRPNLHGDGAALVGTPVPVHFEAMAPFRLGAAAPAFDPASALADGGSATPEVRARRVPLGAITVDGRDDEGAWAQAVPARWDTDYRGGKTPYPTEARVLWSPSPNGALYVAFRLENAGLSVDASRPVAEERLRLYEEDCVELFLAPDPTKPSRYVEVELGPRGHFFDLFIDREVKREDIPWSAGLTVKTTVDEGRHRAIVEAVLRAPEITQALHPGARLPLALFRMEGAPVKGGPRTYLAFRPPRTAKPNFHVPEAFGLLVLDP